MRYDALRTKIRSNLFTPREVSQQFPQENSLAIRTQLARFIKRGRISAIQRGLYCFNVGALDPFVLATRLYQPSYISCESALQYYGMIPDVPQAVVSVSLTTTKTFSNRCGRFYYSKIKQELFWGYETVQSTHDNGYFLLAQREKALLDYMYIRSIKNLTGLRLQMAGFNLARFTTYARYFPSWVRAVTLPKL